MTTLATVPEREVAVAGRGNARTERYQSWGRYPKAAHRSVTKIYWRDELVDALRRAEPASLLPYGMGRSYGDCCLNSGRDLLDCTALNRILDYDWETGRICVEGGITLGDLLKVIVPRGWFLSVTPGTKFVSVGGAIANDVHGKNHHRAGTFGCYVTCFELLRSDGKRLLCSPEENTNLFQATIGGLGLTGVILWAEIRLQPIPSPLMEMERIRFASLREFMDIAAASEQDFEYTVAWVDCLASGKQLGRGLFTRGNHAERATPNIIKKKMPLVIPVD